MIVRFERRGGGQYLILNHDTGEHVGRLIQQHAHRWNIYVGADPAAEVRVAHAATLLSTLKTARSLFERNTVLE